MPCGWFDVKPWPCWCCLIVNYIIGNKLHWISVKTQNAFARLRPFCSSLGVFNEHALFIYPAFQSATAVSITRSLGFYSHVHCRPLTRNSSIEDAHHRTHYYPFVRGTHRSPLHSPPKGLVMQNSDFFSLMLAWTIRSTNNQVAGDLRGHDAHVTSL